MRLKTRVIAHEVLSGMSGGLLLAVQGLFFLEKGAEPWQLGLLLGAAVVSTSVFELPFGALADLHGRIKVFRIARTVFLIASLIAIFATSFWHLMITMTLFGLAEALKTGAIDAWVAEQITARGEKDKFQSYVSSFQAAQGAGLAIGAIGGGYIPVIMPTLTGFPPTTWNLIFTCTLITIHLLSTPYLFKEGETIPEAHKDNRMFAQVISGVKFSLSNRIIRDLLLIGALVGLGMISVEAYWQARLTAIAGAPTYALLGWTTGGYFAMGIAGPIVITAIAARFKASPSLQLLIMPFVFAASIYTIGIQTDIAPFIMAYMATMLFMSMFSPPAITLLNDQTPDELRSTMHSVFSLSLRGGAAISAFGFASLVKLWGIAQVWQLIALITLIIGIFRLFTAARNKPEVANT